MNREHLKCTLDKPGVMRFGICLPNYGESLSVKGLRAVALEAEELGYESIWTTDHILMPKKSGTPYERIFDSLASLAYLAPLTRKVRLGVSSLIIAMRNPLVVARQLATIDAFSGGRVILAIGVGWNEREFSFVGSDFHRRGATVNESIRLLRGIWSGKAHFHSTSIPQNFEDTVLEPKPISKKLPIWIGGVSKAAMKRAVDLGDAWHPNAFPLDAFRKLVSQFREVSPAAKEKSICVRIGLDCRASRSEYTGAQGEKRILLSADMRQNGRILEELESLGVSYAVLATNPDGRVETREQHRSMRAFAKEFLS